MKQFLMLSFVVLTLSGCLSASPPEVPSSGSGPLNEGNFSKRAIRALCANQVRCGLYESAVNCEATNLKTFDPPFLTDGAPVRQVLDLEGAVACLAALEKVAVCLDAPQDVQTLPDPDLQWELGNLIRPTIDVRLACGRIWVGNVERGGDCRSSLQCKLEDSCGQAQNDALRTTCKARVPVGAKPINIGYEQCAVGAFFSFQEDVCVTKIPLGGDCFLASGNHRVPGRCFDRNATCGVFVESGQWKDLCAPSVREAVVQEGESCWAHADCLPGLQCAGSRCTRLVSLGQRCASDGEPFCRQDLICEDQRCVAKPL